MCLQALTQRAECLFEEFNNSSDVYIIASVDQEANENTAQLIINGLSLLGTTETCRSSFIPFLCLYLFPLCDENGTVSRPSRDQCIEVSTVACKDEWQNALSIPYVKQQLPVCESLSATSYCEGVFILISLMDREALFCSSQDLLEAVKTPTAFCSFIGSVYCYALLQQAIWWICHVAALFWKIKFPFHAKAFNNVKFVHLMVVVATLLLPVAPVISAFLTGGFTMSSFPPVSCVTKNGNAVYFTLILPISLIVAIVALAGFSIATSTGEVYVQNVIKYFACEAGGIKQICDSQRKEFESFMNPGVDMVAYILLVLQDQMFKQLTINVS
eukprot:Em0018g579a